MYTSLCVYTFALTCLDCGYHLELFVVFWLIVWLSALSTVDSSFSIHLIPALKFSKNTDSNIALFSCTLDCVMPLPLFQGKSRLFRHAFPLLCLPSLQSVVVTAFCTTLSGFVFSAVVIIITQARYSHRRNSARTTGGKAKRERETRERVFFVSGIIC